MKRYFLPLVSVLLLSSCTSVEDFGAYWDKGFVDPALEGTWKKIGRPGVELSNIPGADKLVYANNGRSYTFQLVNPLDEKVSAEVAAQRKKDSERRFDVRTLEIGKHRFAKTRGRDGKQDGLIERYEIAGNILREYWMDNGAAVDFIERDHPNARNIRKNMGEGRYIVIETFDDEVFQILSEISDDPAYWNLNCRYRKIP